MDPIYSVFDRLGLPRELPMDDNRAPELDFARLAGDVQRNLGLNFLLNFYVSEDVRNTSHNRMMVSVLFFGIRIEGPVLERRGLYNGLRDLEGE